MILKDFKIEFSTIGKGEKEMSVLQFSADIIIKRDDKTYYVPLVKRLEILSNNYILHEYESFLYDFMHHARKISDRWVVKVESVFNPSMGDTTKGKVITEVPFDIIRDI